MAIFNETHAQASRKYVAEQGIVIPNISKIFQTFWSHSSIFAKEKLPKNLNLQSFIPCTTILWNSLPIEYFTLTYDLSSFKSRINRHLLTVGSF